VKTIVVVDGSQDDTYTFEDLGNAVRKARVDLGIPVEFDSGLPMYAARDVSNRYCAIGKVLYSCVDGNSEDDDGTIVYIKACLNGTEPADVLHYASSDTEFPQQGTEELWFDEAQFESYRRLGSHIVEEIWKKKPVEATDTPVEQFVTAAKNYVGPKPDIKFISWPKPSQFVGSAKGTLGSQGFQPTDVTLTWDLKQR
jgi:hypothetical protein